MLDCCGYNSKDVNLGDTDCLAVLGCLAPLHEMSSRAFLYLPFLFHNIPIAIQKTLLLLSPRKIVQMPTFIPTVENRYEVRSSYYDSMQIIIPSEYRLQWIEGVIKLS